MPTIFDTKFLDSYFLLALTKVQQEFQSQAEEVFAAYQLDMPVVCDATLQFIAKNAPVSISDISAGLNDTHQITAQRVEKLVKLGVVLRTRDPEDQRRFNLTLTEFGSDQAARLERAMELASMAYQQIYEEIGVNIQDVMTSTLEALRRAPVLDRMSALETPTIENPALDQKE